MELGRVLDKISFYFNMSDVRKYILKREVSSDIRPMLKDQKF